MIKCKIKNVKKEINAVSSQILNHHLNVSDNYKFGIEYFGPFLYGYTRWLYSSIKEKNYEKIFFLSRDGFMMKKAFDILNKKNIKCEYVYFSRKSIRQALLNKSRNYDESLTYLTKEHYISFAKFLEYYGFPKSEQKKISIKYNIPLEKEYVFSKLKINKQLEKIYYDNKEFINQYSIVQEELLEKYIKQIGMNGKCAIVDIGWHGSMQFYLEEFFRVRNLNIYLDGYYVGINPVSDLVGNTFGYLYEKNDLKLRKSVLCFLGVYESLFQSFEGSTIGYIEKNFNVKPELSKYEYENDKKAICGMKEWKEGALDFIKKISLRQDILVENKIWAIPLINVGKNPTNKQIKLFEFLYNVDGIKNYYVCQKSLWEYDLEEFIHSLSNSVWKTGFMKSAFKIPLPYFWIYELIRK